MKALQNIPEKKIVKWVVHLVLNKFLITLKKMENN